MNIPPDGRRRKQEKRLAATHPAGGMDRPWMGPHHHERSASRYCKLRRNKRTLVILTAVLALAGTGPAQTRRTTVASSASSEWKAGDCESSDTLSLNSRIPAYLRVPDTLPELHEVLRNSREPHDAYIRIAEIGNEETVPLLLARLRLDYGASEPTDVPGVARAMIDTQAHLISALRSITNTDQGYYYPRWEAWWEANRTFPRQRWIMDGFAVGGLHPVEPVDERFGLELIEALASQRFYYRPNAERLLRTVPAEARLKWVALATASGERSRRLGAIEDLSQIDKTGFEDLLRKLTADGDIEIRRRALTVLNERLAGSTYVQPPAGDRFCRVEPGTGEETYVESVSFAGDMLIVAYRNWIRAFDTKTHRERWNRRTADGIGEIVLAAGEQVILASRYGALLALDMQGRVRWNRPSDSQHWTDESANELTHLFWWNDELIVVRWHTLEHVDPSIGATKSTYQAKGYIGGADATDTSLCSVDGSGLRCMNGGNREFLNGRGVSVTSNRICTVSGDGGDYRLACLSGSTLSELWTRSFRYGIASPVQDGLRVVVETYEGLTALRSVDGSILWTITEDMNSYHMPTAYGLLTRDGTGRTELRDPQTGELRRLWPNVYGTKAAVQGKWAAIADSDVVWLLDLSIGDKSR